MTAPGAAPATPSVALPAGHAWDATRWRALLDALPPHALAAWVADRRWSGARGERLAGCHVASIVPLPTDPPAAWLVVEADCAGARVRWQVPLLLEPQPAPGGAVAGPALADVHDAAAAWRLVDAPQSAAFRDALYRALAVGVTVVGEEVRWAAEPMGGGAGWASAATPPSRVGSAEQSNTSIVYGSAAILKLFRRLARGEHPDVEITRFLTRVGFAHTPPLLGTLRLDDAAGTSVAGMLQEFLPGSTDAWEYALDAGRRDVGGGGAAAGAGFAADARRLGVVTRALHDALASDPADPAFAPEPATRADVASWAAAARRSLDAGVALLGERLRAGTVPASTGTGAGDLAARADAVRAAIDGLAERVGEDAGARVRHHGDYHLGQVLHTPDGRWWVIDFEGEPSRPLDDRRAKHCPLRDVAGMLRSFAYAAASVAGERPSTERTDTRAAAERWERDARAAFLDGYAAAGPAAFLPRADASRTALVALFEIEKLFYELAYELRNRPDWVWIPLSGIARWMA